MKDNRHVLDKSNPRFVAMVIAGSMAGVAAVIVGIFSVFG